VRLKSTESGGHLESCFESLLYNSSLHVLLNLNYAYLRHSGVL
jgi:hypothetical protein